MSTAGEPATTDLIRWTCTVPVEVAEAIGNHLTDLGAEVFVRNGATLHIFWEETDVDLDAAVEAIWSLAGSHFEITQEEFHRRDIHILHPDEDTDADEDTDGDEEATEFHPENVEPLEVKEL